MRNESDYDEMLEMLEWRRVPAPKSMAHAPVMVAGTIHRWSDGYWETGARDVCSVERGEARDGYIIPPISAGRTFSLGPPTPDTRISIRRVGAQGTFTVFTADGPVEVPAGDTVTFEAVRRAPKPMRVFRFRDDAWQVPDGVDSCFVEIEVGSSLDRTGVVLQGYDAAAARGDEPRHLLDAIWRTKATRLSTWAEWFDATLSKAAHDYLDAAMSAARVYGNAPSGNDDVMPSVALGLALADIISERGMKVYDLVDFGADTYGTIVYDYMIRVKRDIASRLAGNPGEVQEPQKTT